MKRKRIIRAVSVGMAVTMLAGMLLTGCEKDSEPKETLTVFNYSEYIDPAVLDMFEDETGIEIKYEEGVTPEDMYTKYSAGVIDYDLICTTDYMIEKLINEGELQKIDTSSWEYAENIGDKYWDFAKTFDPENVYALPYFWGTVGILYNTKEVSEPVDSWEVLFNGEYAGEIIMQNSMRDSYMVALKYLGYSLNTTDENEIKEAQELLLNQKKDVSAYLVDEVRDEVVAGNAIMGVVYSGEAYLGQEYNPDLAYVVPKEGSNIWLDCWAVTKDCKNPEAAQKFLDFLCREDIAMMNFEYIYFSTPNEAVIDALDDEMRNNPALVPDDSKLENCEVCRETDANTLQLFNDYWKELKAK